MTLSLPPVFSKYGAPMGRRETCCFNLESPVNLVRVRLDRGGYDSGGAYWGIGAPLYWAFQDGTGAEAFFRAADRAAAKALFRSEYCADARFYR